MLSGYVDELNCSMVEFQRFAPPSSSGLGRGPLKAKTRVRTSLGAPKNKCRIIPAFFLTKLRLGGWYKKLSVMRIGGGFSTRE